MPRGATWILSAMAFGALFLSACKDCDESCDYLKEYQRFQCTKPPYNLCDGQGNPKRPLNREEVEYVKGHCGDCSSCNPCSYVATIFK